MDDTIQNQPQTQAPVNLNKKVPPYFLLAVVAVLILGISAYLVFFRQLIPSIISPKASPTAKKALVTIKTKSYELPNEKGVQIYLSSKDESAEIAAFQIKFSLPSDQKKENISIKMNPQLESQAWKFPIARFEEEDGKPVIKISGFRLGNSPYQVKGNLLIATVTSKNKADISLTLDDKSTLLYSSDAITEVPFDKASE